MLRFSSNLGFLWFELKRVAAFEIPGNLFWRLVSMI